MWVFDEDFYQAATFHQEKFKPSHKKTPRALGNHREAMIMLLMKCKNARANGNF